MISGYHNYHHTFPWDYSASEYGWRSNFNITTLLIDFFEWCGLAYDLKKSPETLIKARQERSGDGNKLKSLRVNRLIDWVFGISITVSQLLVSFALRNLVFWIKGL